MKRHKCYSSKCEQVLSSGPTGEAFNTPQRPPTKCTGKGPERWTVKAPLKNSGYRSFCSSRHFVVITISSRRSRRLVDENRRLPSVTTESRRRLLMPSLRLLLLQWTFHLPAPWVLYSTDHSRNTIITTTTTKTTTTTTTTSTSSSTSRSIYTPHVLLWQ